MKSHFGSIRLGHVAPFVCEGRNSKTLHFSLQAVQSKMSNSRPFDLALDYTRTMMGFLTLNRHPKHIAMIGLGGGSLAKFCYRHLPKTRITVLEINPHVIALRDDFLIPANDARFTVIEADGAVFLRESNQQFDVVLVDGFDHQGIPPQLCSQSFYDDCFGALTERGVMVTNLHNGEPMYESFIGRVDLAFNGNFAEVAANHNGNVIVFGAREIPISPKSLQCKIDHCHAVWEQRWSSSTDFQLNEIYGTSDATA
jgi:spermidine synthase